MPAKWIKEYQRDREVNNLEGCQEDAFATAFKIELVYGRIAGLEPLPSRVTRAVENALRAAQEAELWTKLAIEELQSVPDDHEEATP